MEKATEMNPFTDDDLKRLKERLMLDRSTAIANSFPTEEIDSLEALIARLEAAEKVCNATAEAIVCLHNGLPCCMDGCEIKATGALGIWRKACGR